MSDWWSRRLGSGNGSPTPSQPTGQWPDQRPVYPVEAYQQPNPTGIKVTIGNLFEAAAHWRGGAGHRNSTTCPRCGGGNLFRRVVGAKEAAPLCEDCGWNPLWEQGLPENWQAP